MTTILKWRRSVAEGHTLKYAAIAEQRINLSDVVTWEHIKFSDYCSRWTMQFQG